MQVSHGVERLTPAITALQNEAIIGKPGISQALNVISRVGGPTIGKTLFRRRLAERKADTILAVKLALKVNQGPDIFRFFFLH